MVNQNMYGNIKNVKMYSNPLGFLMFMGVNLMIPIQIQKFWGKKYFKHQYYEYLDEELESVDGLEGDFY